MRKLIAETAWHHEGDYLFMKDLISEICERSAANIVKMHITLDLDEYMSKDHDAYDILRNWLLSSEQWEELISIVQASGKEIMLLLNDTRAVNFASQFNPEMIEIHSVCLNVPRLQRAVLEKINNKTKIVIGVGGCTLEEVDEAVRVFDNRETILMFGFQNYPTKYEDVNLGKIRKIQALYSDKKYGYADHTAWDSPHNELITLLGAASGMSYIEKHVTTNYGEKRTDWPAAISIEMFNELIEKLKILDTLNGDGNLEMNQGELDYSIFGPMKKAAVLTKDVKEGDIFSKEMIKFIRTENISDISQVNIAQSFGKNINIDMAKGSILMKKSLI